MPVMLPLLLALPLLAEGFETDASRALASLEGPAIWATPLVWQREELSIATGNAREVTFEVQLARAGGAVWIDGLNASVPVRNSSFEDPAPDGGGPPGWEPSAGAAATVLLAGAEGPHAVRLTGTEGGAAIRQVLPCEPLTVVRVSVLLARENPEASVVVSLRMGPSEPDAREARAQPAFGLPPSRLGARVARLEDGGRLAVPIPEATQALRIGLDARGAGASLRCTLREATGETARSVTLSAPPRWGRMWPLRVLRRAGGPCLLEVEARGGTLEVDNLDWAPPGAPVADAASLGEEGYGPLGPLMVSGSEELSGPLIMGPLRALSALLMPGRTGEGELTEVALRLDPDLPEEGYRVDSSPDGLSFAASTSRGARYALLEAADLTAPSVDTGAIGVISASATRAPALPWRGVWLTTDGLGADLEAAASLRLRYVCLDPPNEAGFESQVRAATEQSAQARSRALEPVPVLRLWGASALAESPLIAEGARVLEEAATFDADGRATLARTTALIGKDRGLVVTDLDDRASYEEGLDYTIQPGEGEFVLGTGFRPDGERWLLERTPDSRIAPEQTVLVSYDAAETGRSDSPVCPALSATLEALSAQLDRLRLATDCQWVRIDAGPRLPGAADGACLECGRTPRWLLRDLVRRLALHAEQGREVTRVLVPMSAWPGDAGALTAPLDALPANAVFVVEAGRCGPDGFADLLSELRGSREREWLIAVGDAPGCAEAWARDAVEARAAGSRCLGLLAAPSDGRPAPAWEVARAGWRGR